MQLAQEAGTLNHRVFVPELTKINELILISLGNIFLLLYYHRSGAKVIIMVLKLCKDDPYLSQLMNYTERASENESPKG